MPRWIFVFVLCLPLALLAQVIRLSPLLTFVLAALSIIPLAGAISDATEDLSQTTGPRIGGLLNATFGNAAELILNIFVLAEGLDDVVRAAISGSIISNALLVLGTSMLLGGLRYGPQRFVARNAGQYSTMLALAVIGLVIPSVLDLTGGPRPGQAIGITAEDRLSVVVAVVLLMSYTVYILFSVFGVRSSTTAHVSRRRRRQDRALGASARLTRPKATTRASSPAQGAQARAARAAQASNTRATSEREAASAPQTKATSGAPEHEQRVPENTRGNEKKKPSGVPWRTLAVLAGATVLVALASEVLSGAIEPVARQLGLSTFFVGLIFLPLIGNAAEFTTAVRVALDNKMEATMAVTAGSSIQVALLLAPVLVLISLLFGRVLILDFTPLELVIFGLVAGLYALVSLDGESTWLEGMQLIAFYLIVAAAAFLAP